MKLPYSVLLLLSVGSLWANTDNLKKLGSRYLDERQAAAKALGKSSEEECKTLVPALVEKVQKGTWFEQQSAAAALQQLGPKAKAGSGGLAEAASAAIKRSDWSLATAIVDALQKIDPDAFKTVVPVLLPMMKDKKSGEDVLAIALLGRMKPLPSTVIDQLLPMFKDSALGPVAIETAGSTANPSQKLIKALAAELKSTKKERVIAAILAFRKMGPKAEVAIPGLVRALELPGCTIPAAQTLKMIGPAAAKSLPNLLQAAAANPDAALEIQAALEAIKTKNILPTARPANITCVEGGRTDVIVKISDPDDVTAAVKMSLVAQPNHGTAEITGRRQIEYRSKPGFVGKDHFSFAGTDAKGKSKPAVVFVTVEADKAPPKINSVQTALNLSGLTITFSEPVNRAAGVAKNYQIVDPSIAVKEAKLDASGTTVVLKTGKLKEGSTYRIKATAITDRAKTPNPMVPAEHQFKATSLVPGLNVQTFRNKTLAGRPKKLRHSVIDFPKGLPGYGENFSARWTGKLKPTKTGKHTILVTADDGIRIWLGGKKIIDKWIDQSPTEYSGTIQLQAGKMLDLKIEFFNGAGPHTLILSWEAPGIKKQVIPKTSLFSLPKK